MAWIERRCVEVRGESVTTAALWVRAGGAKWLCVRWDYLVSTLYLLWNLLFYFFSFFNLSGEFAQMFSLSGIKRRLFNLWLSSCDTCIVSVSDRSCTFFCIFYFKKGTHLTRIYHFQQIHASNLGQRPLSERCMLENGCSKLDISWNLTHPF